jgi:hypothetical protein
MFRCALCSWPSIWMSVFTGGAAASLPGACARGVSVGTGAFVKISGWRSISMTSACLVMAQNPGKSGSATLRTGAWTRMRLAAACQRPGSAYATGSAKIEPRFSAARAAMRISSQTWRANI